MKIKKADAFFDLVIFQIKISTFGSLSPILYVKKDLNFGRFFDFIFPWS